MKKDILGIRNYETDRVHAYSEDFSDFGMLCHWIWEMAAGEADITKKGAEYIEKKYHWDNFIEKFLEEYPNFSKEHNYQAFFRHLKNEARDI